MDRVLKFNCNLEIYCWILWIYYTNATALRGNQYSGMTFFTIKPLSETLHFLIHLHFSTVAKNIFLKFTLASLTVRQLVDSSLPLLPPFLTPHPSHLFNPLLLCLKPSQCLGIRVCVCVKQAASLKEHCGPLSCQLWLRAGLVEAQLFSGGISPVQHTALFPNALPALAQGQDGSGGGGGWVCTALPGTQNASTPQRHTGQGAFMAWTLLWDVNRMEWLTQCAQEAQGRKGNLLLKAFENPEESVYALAKCKSSYSDDLHWTK